MNESEFSIIGQPLPSIDARVKVTGEAKYVEDLKMPGMLHGKTLRSPIAHGRILRVDTSKAKRIVGVKCVVTAKDSPRIKYGRIVADELILAEDKVRFVGDEVAAVAAVDKDTAEEAVAMIRVEYEELPAVFDPEEAMAPGAPLVHEAANNIAFKIQLSRGDVQKGLGSADIVVQERFEAPMVHPAYLEPVGCVAFYDAYGVLTVWLPFQKLFPVRSLLSRALNMPAGKIRIIQPMVGGAFGGKIDQKPPAVLSLLALKTQKPVQMVNTRDEEFIAGRGRVASKIDLTMGIKKDGTVVAKRTRVIADNGAYSSNAPATLNTMAIRPDNMYRFQNLETEAFLVYTNKLPSTAFRGFGNPQMTFALESMLDILAEKAGMDPVELRLKNVSKTGDVTAHGWKIRSGGLQECIERASREIGWKEKRGKRIPHRGLGIACMIHVSGGRTAGNFDGSSAFMKLNEDGNFDLLIGEGDIGQGARTVFAQIAAEVLHVGVHNINISVADTAMTPFCDGASASRITFVGGNAVKAAAEAVREKILDVAAEMLEASKEELLVKKGTVSVKKSEGRTASFVEIASFALNRKGGYPIMEKGTFDADDEKVHPQTRYGNYSGAYPFAAHIAEVEVDVETGKVNILNYVAAHDLGRVINPMAAEGQVFGGVAQGIGYALTEEMTFREGKITNPSFSDYKVMSAESMPPVKPIFVETIDPAGPFGAKGLGEPTLVPVPPAIANAIYDAVGVRMKTLPMTPEKILRGLEELKQKS